MRNKSNRRRKAVLALAIALMIGGGLLTSNARSEPSVSESSDSAFRENDSVHVKTEHHYNSSVERANDDGAPRRRRKEALMGA